ncbi:uncharacterized protein LOC142784453 [Rhipicephalus microplus]|uniref:uncharacterized protein LOC142784453 n=1 Tax=Rhipicephalus microplus TaxID=6941 RepID=UPI003F6AD0D3
MWQRWDAAVISTTRGLSCDTDPRAVSSARPQPDAVFARVYAEFLAVECRPALPWRGSCSPRERTSLSSGISSDTTSVPNSWQERRKNLWFPFLLMKDLKRWGVMISPPGTAWRPAPPTSPCGVAPERSSYHCLWPLLTVAICWIPLYGSPPASGEPRQHQGNLAELPYETEQGLEPGITYRAPG